MSGIIADIFAPLGSMFSSSGWGSSIFGTILSTLGNIFNQISRIISTSFFLQIVGMIVIIGVFFRNFFDFVFVLLKFLFYQFPIWFFGLPKWPSNLFKPEKDDKKKEVGFIPFIIRYVMVIAIGISKLPKCVLWYTLDTLGWIIYLPFRFVFWLLDYFIPELKITDKEHKGWDFLDEIDYFLHGPKNNWFMYQYEDQSTPDPDPHSLNLGFHIIHFPNSVMETCYSISPYSLAECKGASDVVNSFTDMINSATLPF